MIPRQNRPENTRNSGPGTALIPPVAALAVLLAFGCAPGTGECVANYQFQGEVRKSNYTRAECEEECAIIGRTLSCFFVGRGQTAMAPAERYDFEVPLR